MAGALARALGIGAAVVAALALGAVSAQGGPPLPWAGTAGGNLRPAEAAAVGLSPRPGPFPNVDSTGRLQRIQLDAEAKVRALSRDLARDAQASTLRRSADPIAVEQARSAWHLEERLDAQKSEFDWDRVLTPGPWDQPGPVTRRILERSRIQLRTQERQRGVDARADALLPAPPPPPSLGTPPPTSLEPQGR